MNRLILSSAVAVVLLPAQADIVKALFAPAAGTPARPSVVVGTIVDGRAQIQAFGTVKLGSSESAGENTVYEIGSITKGLTGVLLADMALAGEVSLHDTLDTFLPDAAALPESVRRITLLQLATHASGLPRLPANLASSVKDPSNPYAHYGRRELETFLRAYTPPPARTAVEPVYSNLGFGLLGWALALKAGVPYEALLKARVLEPLGMRDTTITLSLDHRRRLAPGHANGRAVSNWDLDVLAGAGAVRSTAADMMKLLEALMRAAARAPDSRIGKAIRLAIEPRGALGAARIGLAWITTSPPAGAPFTWHNGGTGGYRTFIGFTTNGAAGILVLTNGADQSPDPLAVQALQRLR